TLLRSLVSRAFTPRMVAALEPRIRQITDELLDAAMARGSFDLVQDLSFPLPVIVIAQLMGIEPERRNDFKRWSDDLIGTGSAGRPEGREQVQRSMAEFTEYMGRMIAARRRERREDLVSALVAAQDDRNVLSAQDVIDFCMLLLIAGNETTTNLISNA